ncbi:hypothetical protein FHS54_002401 [Sphingobium vermicomposti]|uniref:Uncharacterized protein n=1 Tax=Sphingobium vermicomposti TaxID=529005 RepID=A0A846M692_9SPHN|nr:hypothetical protein [Sphingobium vermicomposti]
MAKLTAANHRPFRGQDRRKKAMVAFLKSDLFLRFFGGFVLGAVGMFAFQPSEPPALVSSAMAASDATL